MRPGRAPALLSSLNGLFRKNDPMTTPFLELREERSRLLEGFSAGKTPRAFQAAYTEIMDQYFRRMLQESDTGRRLFNRKTAFAFLAVGGYGRKELCVHSDIDIIILFGQRIPAAAKALSDEVFFPLWDLGLDLGYGIRTIRDSLALCRRDYEVLTSLMDARFICGASPLYFSLMEKLYDRIVSRRTAAFGRWLDEQDRIRMEKYGDASYLLEPHLKEGIGGLRDYHHILWLAKALFRLGVPRDLEYTGKLSHGEYLGLKKDLAFIWAVRNRLHLHSGRKNDRLAFEYQEKIALDMGFRDRDGALAVERFLGRLHACMSSIKSLHRSFGLAHIPGKALPCAEIPPEYGEEGLDVDKGEINFHSATAILSRPLLLIRIFEYSAASGLTLSMEARRLVREFLFLVNARFRSDNPAVRAFLNILNEKHAVQALDQMLDTGFLEAFIPEFRKISNRVQFDAYHIFPVGRHSIETVRHLKNLGRQKEILLVDIFSDLKKPEVLLLAALLHDIGKAEKHHAKKGVALARAILSRFHYPDRDARNVFFLIRNHLLLAETATRRDLNDEKVVVACARAIGNMERLRMLYLLTWADSRATGPRAWNPWSGNLILELFFKVMHVLEQGELATPRVSQQVRKTVARTRALLKDRGGIPRPGAFIEVMSPRYLLNTHPRDILRHVRMARRIAGKIDGKGNGDAAFAMAHRHDPAEGCWEITFVAADRPGLFSDLAGVLALHNINILSAQVYTWRDGTAVDIFTVGAPPDPIHPDASWRRVRRDVEKTLKGALSPGRRLRQKSASSIFSVKRPARPPQVVVDNRSSDFFTLVEVFADDRIGLLHLITRALFDLGLDIRIAKIATRSDQVVDVFYVRDLYGQKVEDEAQVEKIREALLRRLKRE